MFTDHHYGFMINAPFFSAATIDFVSVCLSSFFVNLLTDKLLMDKF